MFTAEIKNPSLLAVYRFSSSSFKWVYRNALSFAKKTVRDIPELTIRIVFDNDCIIVVTKSIVSVLYLKSTKILDVWRCGK